MASVRPVSRSLPRLLCYSSSSLSCSRALLSQPVTRTAEFHSRARSNSKSPLAAMSRAKYPTAEEIHDMFCNFEKNNPAGVFEHVDGNVRWTVMGTHPLGAVYHSLSEFQTGTLQRLSKIFEDPGLQLRVRNVIGGGDQAWASVELIGEGVCKNGLKFENAYSWNMRFGAQSRKVEEVRAYLDSEMVKQALEENEDVKPPSRRAPIDGSD